MKSFWCVKLALTFLVLLFQLPAFSQNDIQKQINECDSYVKKYREENNKPELLRNLNKLGFLYWQTQDLDKALDVFKESIKLNEEIGNTNAIRTLCSNLGAIYIEKQDFENAITFLTKSVRLNRQMNKKSELLADLINIASSCQSLDRLDESIKLMEEGIILAKELNNIKSLRICYSSLAESYQKKGQSDKAQEYFELAATLTSHLQKEQIKDYQIKTLNAQAHATMAEKELQATADTLQEVIQINTEKQLQIDLLSKEKQLKDLQLEAQKAVEKRRRLIISALSLILILVGASMLIIFKQLRDKKKANKLLDKQKSELAVQHELTLSLNQKITDSIQYASRIQNAVLPPDTLLKELLKDYFVIYRPRNIVSGDFYWMTSKNDLLAIAVADCTGHGVPGAFMSMLGIAFLNEIINKIEVNEHITTFHTDEILNQLRKNVIESLHQDDKESDSKDGMDISICIINFKKNTLEYSGAHNPICIFRNGELTYLEGDRLPVGMHPNAKKSFSRKEFALQKGDTIYMYSDGYSDQFGGAEKVKFTSTNLKKVLTEIQSKPMEEQKEILVKTHLEWKGSNEQLDDITFLGFKYGQPESSSKIDWSHRTILIAEDQDINFALLERVLKETKAYVIRVRNGREAVDFCSSNEVNLILMDYNMPEMDGCEATKQIIKLGKNIPVIAQTALSQDGLKEKMLSAGCVDFILKPLDLKHFIEKISKYL